MIKVYIGNLLENMDIIEVLYPNLGSTERVNVFGSSLFRQFKDPIVSVVHEPRMADYLLIPHHYNSIRNNEKYIAEFSELSDKFSKTILVFFVGDSDEKINLRNSIIFRNSQYRYKKEANEIIIPGYSADISEGHVTYRSKGDSKGGRAIVSFCGWARFDAFKTALTYVIKNSVAVIKFLAGDKNALYHLSGLYFRRKAISILKKARTLDTNFIIRSSYSGHTKTIAMSPEVARKEYTDTMRNSDFVLAPKGDGNFSIRFYEALSLGRIPLLIDTDCVLPLEDEIDYSRFVLKVDYRKMNELGKIVSDFYDSLTNEQFAGMQKAARDAFEKYLKIDVFLRRIFTEEYLRKYKTL